MKDAIKVVFGSLVLGIVVTFISAIIAGAFYFGVTILL